MMAVSETQERWTSVQLLAYTIACTALEGKHTQEPQLCNLEQMFIQIKRKN